ncbi:uncharacterized protein PFL1_03684 [Pseudozyma flocculosa PF-1]|uniref:C2H2-type domain-containing protein n=2 Tax=Pseudozyma flocculosa TaxID=84751 RepID=A0A5C3F654_9BASI|nr:uncharacterized protein PFL1_03684 [Pseudozyma flocculosa PF-1]EPQ28883.1 hypothetical protein PFL1_03684 [Pseudozyma flocculosa PF-1]SPO39325.1 uncharacterized protein PSFLO_04806 [Pseudozyma flocculosa]
MPSKVVYPSLISPHAEQACPLGMNPAAPPAQQVPRSLLHLEALDVFNVSSFSIDVAQEGGRWDLDPEAPWPQPYPRPSPSIELQAGPIFDDGAAELTASSAQAASFCPYRGDIHLATTSYGLRGAVPACFATPLCLHPTPVGAMPAEETFATATGQGCEQGIEAMMDLVFAPEERGCADDVDLAQVPAARTSTPLTPDALPPLSADSPPESLAAPQPFYTFGDLLRPAYDPIIKAEDGVAEDEIPSLLFSAHGVGARGPPWSEMTGLPSLDHDAGPFGFERRRINSLPSSSLDLPLTPQTWPSSTQPANISSSGGSSGCKDDGSLSYAGPPASQPPGGREAGMSASASSSADVTTIAPPRPRYPCKASGCEQTFASRWNLSQHVKLHDETRSKDFVCTLPGCGRAYFHHRDLKRHIRKFHTHPAPARSRPPQRLRQPDEAVEDSRPTAVRPFHLPSVLMSSGGLL